MQYSRIKRISEIDHEEDVHFIKVHLVKYRAPWVGRQITELGLPNGIIVAAIQCGQEIIVPRGDVVLLEIDTIVLGAESFRHDRHINLKEVLLRNQNPWTGKYIRDLDISRQTIIVMVKRKNRVLILRGNMILLEGDRVILYTQMHLSDAQNIMI